MRDKHYWGYRTDKANQPYFAAELLAGRLRQGWGYDPGQDLRNLTFDGGAKRNLRILREVKQGDILLVPNVPEWGKTGIVEATEDFDKGYAFTLAPGQKDFGHSFPTILVGTFARSSDASDAAIRRTFRSSSRFWNINYLAEQIERLRRAAESDRGQPTTITQRLDAAVAQATATAREALASSLGETLVKRLQNHEWEQALVETLQVVYPEYEIVRTGGAGEKQHGADIMMRIKSPFSDVRHVVAIQVKDWAGPGDTSALNQIDKATAIEESPDVKLLERWVFLVKARREDNDAFQAEADRRGVGVYYKDDVAALFVRAAVVGMGGEA